VPALVREGDGTVIAIKKHRLIEVATDRQWVSRQFIVTDRWLDQIKPKWVALPSISDVIAVRQNTWPQIDLLCPMSSMQPNDRGSMRAPKTFYFVAGSLLGMVIASSTAFAEAPDISVSAFGIHRCADAPMCVVTGSFSDCKQATIQLAKQDCCGAKARSVSFSLEACTRDSGDMDRRTSR
jgi:hypothetical protein